MSRCVYAGLCQISWCFTYLCWKYPYSCSRNSPTLRYRLLHALIRERGSLIPLRLGPGAPGSELADAVTEAGFHVARLGESQLHEFFESYPRGGATRESGAFRIEL